MRVAPDIEERAALCQFESEATRQDAENLAAQEQGFTDAEHYWQWLADYVRLRSMT
jgi:hypothetical protein